MSDQKKTILAFLPILAILIAIGVTLVLSKQQQDIRTRAQTPSASQSRTNDIASISKIRSTTYYDFPDEIGASRKFVSDFTTDLPKIKKNNFNTVWLVISLRFFFADATSQTINTQAFADLKAVLDRLRVNNMKAILAMSYGSRQGCDILTDQTAFQKYLADHQDFLAQVEEYSDMVYIVTFSESVWDCSKPIFGSLDYPTPAGGERMSKLIKPTLGNLPNLLNQEMRNKFIFGYHDLFMAEGWNEGTPSMQEGAYDFISLAKYFDHPVTEETIINKYTEAIGKVKNFYPDMPLFFGETGASYCHGDGTNQDIQAWIISKMVNYLQSNNYGYNIWQWKPINFRDSDWEQKDCDFGGHAITRADSSLRPAAEWLEAVMTRSPWTITQIAPPTTAVITPLPTSVVPPTPTLIQHVPSNTIMNGSLAPTPTKASVTGLPMRIVTPQTKARPLLLGDINQDGKIDLFDYNLFTSCYGSKAQSSGCPAPKEADMNNDGLVDGIDYNLFLRSFSS